MRNECDFDMKVVGASEKSVDKFIQMLSNLDAQKHFRKVSDVVEHYRTISPDGEAVISNISGYCDQSGIACMLDGACDNDDTTSLEEQASALGIDIEVFSWEPNEGFSEHAICTKDGRCSYEKREYHYYWYNTKEYKNFAEFAEDYDLPEDITIADLDEHDCIEVGGFKSSFEPIWSI